MTDERLDPQLERIAAALPRGTGVVVRHRSLPPAARIALVARLKALARRRGLVLSVADPPPGVRADGVHLGSTVRRRPLRRWPLVTAAVHDRREAARAIGLGAHVLFVSPVFATASHPRRAPLGPLRFGLLARALPRPVVALGGVDRRRFRRLEPLGAWGWAAIGAWAAQKASAPPR
ncbi:MAG: thiamine phosphate synthase [Sphingomonadaceae bacterium]|uniref:thiamine phosphate synthase n=1 Tax=Thermaurantiacus sp. TaxID=2820283 RepID=UPI00298EF068|nr:thiamine phosphate synthase [Thermaurantiacus sp.]MCS6987516.1 thiamine phosphate synthase [Sphingomonadaceae bacterium]MDW8415117.1 thiamine phosphate synthase [Thermaurantiacus sp.]